MHYIGIVGRDRIDSDFGVTFAEFPGCVSAGRTFNELIRNAAEALSLHIEGMRKDGEEIPEPLAFERVVAAADGPPAAFVVVTP